MNARPALQGVVAGLGGAFLRGLLFQPLDVALGVLVVKRPVGSLALFASPIGHIPALVAEDTEFPVVRRANCSAPYVNPFIESIDPAIDTLKGRSPSPPSAALPVLVSELDIVSEFDVFAIGMIFENGESLALVGQPYITPRFIDSGNPVVFSLQGVPGGQRRPYLPDAGPIEKIFCASNDIVVSEALRVSIATENHEDQDHER